MKHLLHHPITQRMRRYLRLAAVIVAVILAVSVVTAVTVDLGPVLKGQAEKFASSFLKRPLHIGKLSARLWAGKFVFDDLTIEGLTPQSRPFLVTKRISVSMPWSTLFRRRVVFDAIEMNDWRMYIEQLPGGVHNLPNFKTNGSGGPSTWTFTAQYVRVYRGDFMYEDHGTPWSTSSKNLEIIVARPTTEYRGQVRYLDGMTAIQNYVPMRTEMTATFKIDDGDVIFDKMDLVTDGTRSMLTGHADLPHFPEMTFQVRSRVNFPKMREVFFARDTFSLHGDGDFTGVYHLFKGGRELKGSFTTPVLGVNDYRFANVRGSLLWLPERFEVTNGTSDLFGGRARFTYTMAPFGNPTTPARAVFDTALRDVELTAYTNFLKTPGLRLNGRASGHVVLDYPLGHFSEHRGAGVLHVDAPDGERLLTRDISPDAIAQGEREAELPGPFSKHTPAAPVPIGGDMAFAYGPDWINISPSCVATSSTLVEFQGRTAWGDQSQMPFHVSSADWQASDRLLAGILTAFGSPSQAIEVSGHGTFDGVMTESFTRPRIEGDFSGENMRAWHVNWGRAAGHTVIENRYADVKDVLIESGDSRIAADGRFSIGYPREDGGEQINARIRVTKRQVPDLRAAFNLYDYPIDGVLSGEFHVFGAYENPYGFGLMSIARGRAYHEPFDLATAALRFEGAGVRLDSLEIRKGDGRGVGAAYVGFDGTYSFNLDGRRIPVEQIALAKLNNAPPLTGFLEFSAGGRGTFVDPSYDVKASVNDFFLGDEGIGRVSGDLALRGDVLTLRVEAASPRLAVSGAGRIDVGDVMNADVSFTVSDTSLDPYVRAFQPNFPPFTTAVAGGRIHVVGDPTNLNALHVESDVDRLDIGLFDYRLHNASPIRLTLAGDQLQVKQMHLAGEDTELDVTGIMNVTTQQVDVRASGTANLGILQGFVRDVRSSGRASVAAVISGSATSPIVNGAMTIDNGRIRQFALPHALENINGVVQFDSHGLLLDGLTARLGGGDVSFGGRVDVEGYQPSTLDVTMTGRNMRLRFPEGMNSQVDADLALTGTVDSALLSGSVLVRSAIYKRAFDAAGGLFDVTTATATAGGAGSLQPTLPLRYDVRISVPSTLRIENNAARISATADLQLSGTYDKPLVFGRVDIDRGDLTVEGKRYVVTRGTIDFNNPTRIQPFLDVEGETRIRVPGQTYRVTVSAAGTFDQFNFQLSSDPPLPEVEAIALLFGDVAPGQNVNPTGTTSFSQYSTAITPQQQLLRERVTRQLTGALSAEVERVVEQTFGVDTFQLTPSLGDVYHQSSRVTPGARLTIGKRISDRVYITYSRSLVSTTRDQIILLEYDQSDRFSWVLSQNEDDTYALDVRVRHVF